MGLLEKFGSDAVRYWAASARLGLDAAFDESPDEDLARRLAIKVAQRLQFRSHDGRGRESWIWISRTLSALDRSVLAALLKIVSSATTALENYEHAPCASHRLLLLDFL